MTRSDIIWRSLRHHLQAHAALAGGVAVATATLTGALLVGDSVRGSLRERALQRIAGAEEMLSAEHRVFRADLGNILQQQNGGTVASLLSAAASVSLPDGSARANRTHVFGVDRGFGALSGWSVENIDPSSVWINQALAQSLNARPGDTLVLRMESAESAPAEVAIARREGRSAGLRLKLAGIVPDKTGGALQPVSSGQPARNAFVDRATLGQALRQPTGANLLLSSGGKRPWQEALSRSFALSDAGLKVTALANGGCELTSDRIFIEPRVQAAASKIPSAQPLLTYLATQISSGSNLVPYSMVCAAGPPYTPDDLLPDEIVLTDWLARELKTGPGEMLALSWYDPDSGAALVERTNEFRVRAVVPLQDRYADPSLMPDFPGIKEAERTRDWQGGFPLVYPIQPRDEAYWEKHRGTPKAWISLAAGQQRWANRYGSLTAIRFPAATDQVAATLREHLTPDQVGLQFTPLRNNALQSAAGGQDFGQLFLGFSFFLLGAALLLIVLLFRLALERRMTELGTLAALGFTTAELRKLIVLEAALPLLVGVAVGLPGGVLYARMLLWALGHVWLAAIGGSSLGFHSQPLSFFLAASVSLGASLVSIHLVLRRFSRRSTRDLLGGLEAMSSRRSRRWDAPAGFAAIAFALTVLAAAAASSEGLSPGPFFGAGALLLVGSLLLVRWRLCRISQRPCSVASMSRIAWTSLARRRSRSMAAISLLAAGSFLVVAVSAFHRSETRPNEKSSGTGGFGLVADSALPVFEDLANTNRLATFLPDALPGRIVPVRVRAGDDASCLNLDRAQRPRLLGVRPGDFTGRFTFEGSARGSGWAALTNALSPDVIPAIGDAESIRWALGKKLGDRIDYQDESGRRFQVQLVASVSSSILQGSLVIDESQFRARFPASAGWRLFLVETAPADIAKARQALSQAFEDYGWDIERTADRLAAFHAVQNTYLGAFGVLGGLGLFLGTVGLAVILLRNVLERRSELAWMVAAGFRPSDVRQVIFREHLLILGTGLTVGTLAAALAVIPAWLTPGNSIPWMTLGLVLVGVAIAGTVWTSLAARWCLRGRLLEALRAE